MKINKQFLSHFILLVLATFLGKGVAFFKEMMVAYYFGTSKNLDILLFSLTLSGTIITIISSGMESTILPNYLRLKNKSVREKNSYLFLVFTLFIIISFLLYLIIQAFGLNIISLIARGFSYQDAVLAKNHLDLFTIFIICEFLSVFFLTLLNSEKIFFFTSIIPSLIPLSIMIMLYYLHNMGVISMIFGILLGVLIQLIASWIKASKYFSFKSLNFSNSRRTYNNILKNYSVLLGSGLFIGLIGITDQSFATQAGVGAVSSLNYAQKIPALLDGIVVMILGKILFSAFSENISLSKHKENKILFMKTLKIVFFITFIIAILLAAFSKELVNLVFVRGKFDYNSLMTVYPIQIAFFLKLPFVAIAIISARMMNSFELNKEMLVINIFSFILNGVLDYILVSRFGVTGIAYATLLTYIWAASLNYFIVKKQFKKIIT